MKKFSKGKLMKLSQILLALSPVMALSIKCSLFIGEATIPEQFKEDE